MLVPNRRGLSKETLDSDQAAFKVVFKASVSTESEAGAGFVVVGGGTRTRRGAAAYSPLSLNYGYMSTASSPGRPLSGMGVHPSAGMYTTTSRCGVTSPAALECQGFARGGAQPPRASRRGRA